MSPVLIAETVAFYALALMLFSRALQAKLLSRFPLFYAYLGYMVVTGLCTLATYFWVPAYNRLAVWSRLLTGLVVEFAVLLEAADHVFYPYAAIRRLGRVLVLLTSAAFFLLFILPALLEARPSSAIILELYKQSALTKGTIILVLLAAARFYRLPLGGNVLGILVGFSVYLAISVANFALAQYYSPAFYARVFSMLVPISYTLSMLIWAVALWRYEPVEAEAPVAREEKELLAQPLRYRLWRFNTVLSRLLGK